MVKKAMFLIIAILCAASLYADSFRFSIVWENTVSSESYLSVVSTDDETSTVTSKELSLTIDEQSVAKVKYRSNEGGTHTIYYRATPLEADGDSKGYRFILRFYDPATETLQARIDVGDRKGLTYPTGSLADTAYSSLDMGQSGSFENKYVLMTVQLLELDIMPIDRQYTSTITIVRQTV